MLDVDVRLSDLISAFSFQLSAFEFGWMLNVDSAEKPPVFEKRAVKRLVKNAAREKQIDPEAIFIV